MKLFGPSERSYPAKPTNSRRISSNPKQQGESQRPSAECLRPASGAEDLTPEGSNGTEQKRRCEYRERQRRSLPHAEVSRDDGDDDQHHRCRKPHQQPLNEQRREDRSVRRAAADRPGEHQLPPTRLLFPPERTNCGEHRPSRHQHRQQPDQTKLGIATHTSQVTRNAVEQSKCEIPLERFGESQAIGLCRVGVSISDDDGGGHQRHDRGEDSESRALTAHRRAKDRSSRRISRQHFPRRASCRGRIRPGTAPREKALGFAD